MEAKPMCPIDSIAPIPQKYNIIHIAQTLCTYQNSVSHSDMDITKPQNSLTQRHYFGISNNVNHSLSELSETRQPSIATTDLTAPLVYETLYTADASGSVFSPQKYAPDNKHKIGWWSQFAETKSQNGVIVFFDHNCNPLTTIPLNPRNGLF